MNRNDLLEALKHATEGLFVISETDAPFECLFWISSAPFSPGQAKKILGDEAPVTQSLEDFLAPFTQPREWHGESQRQDVLRFEQLKKLLEANLSNLNVYGVGEPHERTFWIVGRFAPQEYVLLRTFKVET